MPDQFAFSPAEWTLHEIHNLVGGTWVHAPETDRKIRRFVVNREELASGGDDAVFISLENAAKNAVTPGKVSAIWQNPTVLLKHFHGKLAGAVLDHAVEGLPSDFPQLIVDNPAKSLEILALAAGQSYRGKLVVVTGSSGLSATRAMLAGIMEKGHSLVLAPEGVNNRIGRALALAELRNDPEYGVLSLPVAAYSHNRTGADAGIRPLVVVITTTDALPESNLPTREDVAKAISRLFPSLREGGAIVLNGDDPAFSLLSEAAALLGIRLVSYGANKDAHVRLISRKAEGNASKIRARVLDNEVEYTLPALGTQSAMHSLAALAAMAAMRDDTAEAAGALHNFNTPSHTFENVVITTGTGSVTLMAEESTAAQSAPASLPQSLESLREWNTRKLRQIAVLGDIWNGPLPADSAELHIKAAADSLNASEVAMVFALGQRQSSLLAALSPEKTGGLFRSPAALAAAAAQYIRDNDVVLIKGDTQRDDFGKVRPALARLLEERHSKSTSAAPLEYASALFDQDFGAALGLVGNPWRTVPEGLGGVLLVYQVLDSLHQHTIRPEELIILEKPLNLTSRKGGSVAAVNLVKGEQLSLGTVLDLFICTGEISVGLLLMGFLEKKTGQKVRPLLRELADRIGLNPDAVHNVTGSRRRTRYQGFTIDDMKKTANLLFSLPEEALQPLRDKGIVFNGVQFYSGSALHEVDGVLYTLSFGKTAHNVMALAGIGERRLTVCVCGAPDAMAGDYLAAELLMEQRPYLGKYKASHYKPTVRRMPGIVTLCGDTYFGEDYTKARLARGEADPLFLQGYAHSFAKVAPFFSGSDLNIVHFTAPLTLEKQSSLIARPEPLLRGAPGESVRELKRNAIHAVTLAHNHIMDYGRKGLKDTLDALQKYDLFPLGAGMSVEEAQAPLGTEISGRRFLFLSASAFEEQAYQSGYYALMGKPGAACLWEGFYRHLTALRALNKDAVIVVMPHWGYPYSAQPEMLRPLAEQLVAHGADIVIGRGTHTPGMLEYVHGAPVLYSQGNFVLNDDGEGFENSTALPYGYVCRLVVERERLALRLYPIYTLNKETFWQPRPVTEAQFTAVSTFMRASVPEFLCSQDALGYYMELPGRKDASLDDAAGTPE